MRKKWFILFPCVLLLAACTKNTGGGNNNNNGGGNNGGGGNNTNLSITGFSPLHPYVDDTLTMTGTGFNADKTKDTVLLNQAAGINLSATTTQVKLKFPNEDDMNLSLCNCALIQFWTNGKRYIDTFQEVIFKRSLKINYLVDVDNSNLGIGRPGDSILFSGSGFTKSGTVVSVDATTLQGIKIDSGFYTTANIRLPKTIFGTSNDETASAMKIVKVTNADGRTDQKSINFLLSPRMAVFDMQPEHNSYSLSGLTSSGGQVNVTVTGANLKSDASVHLDSNTGVIHTKSNLAVTGFPDKTIIPFNPTGLSTGAYQVSIWRGNTIYGTCSFQIDP